MRCGLQPQPLCPCRASQTADPAQIAQTGQCTADGPVDHPHARAGSGHCAGADAPLAELDIPWSVGLRTGDTSSSERARQGRRLPSALVTTPESLTLLLTRADAKAQMSNLRMLVVDEWHELIGNKRGVQLQLALVRCASGIHN
jgi:hypothetical protein